jgi:hypothetical protein
MSRTKNETFALEVNLILWNALADIIIADFRPGFWDRNSRDRERLLP